MGKKKEEVTVDDIPDLVRSLILEHMNIPNNQIKDNAHFAKDLNMNTLQSIQINIDLEDALGFEITDDDIEKLHTVKQMVDYLRKKMMEERK